MRITDSIYVGLHSNTPYGYYSGVWATIFVGGKKRYSFLTPVAVPAKMTVSINTLHRSHLSAPLNDEEESARLRLLTFIGAVCDVLDPLIAEGSLDELSDTTAAERINQLYKLKQRKRICPYMHF